jgi:hypothetical protein
LLASPDDVINVGVIAKFTGCEIWGELIRQATLAEALFETGAKRAAGLVGDGVFGLEISLAPAGGGRGIPALRRILATSAFEATALLAGGEDGGEAILDLEIDTAEFTCVLEFVGGVAEAGENEQENDSVPELERPFDGAKNHGFSMQ